MGRLDRLVEEAPVEQPGQRIAQGGLGDQGVEVGVLERDRHLRREHVRDATFHLREPAIDADPGHEQDRSDLFADLDGEGHRRMLSVAPGAIRQELGRPRGDLLDAVDPDPFDDRPADHPPPAVDFEIDRPGREPGARLEAIRPVGPAREEGHDVGLEQLGHGLDDGVDDARPIEIGHQRPADREHALDGVEAVASLVVETGGPKRRREGADDQPGQGDLRGADRMLDRPLEVDDAEELAVVDDRRRDLAPDVIARGAVVGVDADVRDELDLSRRSRSSDDPVPDVDLVERRRVAGDADHRQAVASEREIHRHERDLEFMRDVVDDGLDHFADRLRAVEPRHDPIDPLEDGHLLPTLRGQPGRAIL